MISKDNSNIYSLFQNLLPAYDIIKWRLAQSSSVVNSAAVVDSLAGLEQTSFTESEDFCRASEAKCFLALEVAPRFFGNVWGWLLHCTASYD